MVVSLGDMVFCSNWRNIRCLGSSLLLHSIGRSLAALPMPAQPPFPQATSWRIKKLRGTNVLKRKTRKESPKHKSQQRRVGVSEEKIKSKKSVRSGTWQVYAGSVGQVQPRQEIRTKVQGIKVTRAKTYLVELKSPSFLTCDSDSLGSRKWPSWTSLFRPSPLLTSRTLASGAACSAKPHYAKTPRCLGRTLARSSLAA